MYAMHGIPSLGSMDYNAYKRKPQAKQDRDLLRFAWQESGVAVGFGTWREEIVEAMATDRERRHRSEAAAETEALAAEAEVRASEAQIEEWAEAHHLARDLSWHRWHGRQYDLWNEAMAQEEKEQLQKEAQHFEERHASSEENAERQWYARAAWSSEEDLNSALSCWCGNETSYGIGFFCLSM